MDNGVEAREANVFNRDEVLSQIDNLIEIKDDSERSAKTQDFIDARLKLLSESTVPREFSIMSRPRKGFLHPDSGVRRNFMVDPFHIDDPEIYKQLIETIEEFKTNPNWQGKTLREIAPYAILRTIGNYFGNHYGTESTEDRNQAFYLNHSGSDSEDIHLRELKGKRMAVCAEKAATVQNLLSFLGYESELIASSKCRLESLDKEDRGGHMYNVISSGENYLIFDPTNPILLIKDDGGVYATMPAFYPINKDDYQKLVSGGQVEITHNDGKWDGNQAIKGPDQKRIYGGPSQATLVDD